MDNPLTLKPVARTDADEHWMTLALAMAQKAYMGGEVPVGAVVVAGEELLGEGCNAPIGDCDPSAHAEIKALRAAALKRNNYRLPGTTLYVTIEPCTMCLGAIIHARVERLVFGALEPKAGVLQSQAQLASQMNFFNHQLAWTGGVLEEPCSELMRQFFRERRKK